ncbi:nuclear receptor subfamily 5 group A member 2-like [Littorina saxatilis]|uniref:Uncharacterized protein n=1 Tax=Littorina saxatilis TaxID=31220 RepID=A0AAN9GDM4_9CAEN
MMSDLCDRQCSGPMSTTGHLVTIKLSVATLGHGYNMTYRLEKSPQLQHDVTTLEHCGYVVNSQEMVNAALLEYCLSFYPNLKDKIGQILLRLPEIGIISIGMEESLYYKHLNNQVPDQTSC